MLPIFLALLLVSLSVADDKCPKFASPGETFDLRLYLGVWYEIARTETPFEKGMDCVNATYSLKDDGNIDVLNTGKILKENRINVANGIARRTDQINVLKVQFDPRAPEANYWIVDTDFFGYALVYSCTESPVGTFKGAWVLSRTKTMEQSLYDSLADKLSQLGIQKSELRLTEQRAC
ncbi:apolipoprotein D-like [Brevipalpus obovatus]|uniref:apolipoprotein D-like n=1 Tax=Brevipalpus obovatus TaxID=246614 RepID=UPI003D9E97CD